jgi:hypothetical protein
MQYTYLEEFCKKWNGRIVVLIFAIALREGSPYTLHICNVIRNANMKTLQLTTQVKEKTHVQRSEFI